MRVLAAVLLAGAATAPAAAAPAREESAQPPRERIICRRPAQNATRIGARTVCRTESEWRTSRDALPIDERVGEDADTLATVGERTSTGCRGGNDRIPQ